MNSDPNSPADSPTLPTVLFWLPFSTIQECLYFYSLMLT